MIFFKKTLKFLAQVLLVVFALATVMLIYFNIPVTEKNDDAKLGVTFSVRYSREIGLDPKIVLDAALGELGIKKVRIPVYWDSVEPELGKFDYSDLDWQLQAARDHGAEVILAIGQKTPRWPECFVPEYLKSDDEKRKSELLVFIQKTIERYKDNPEIRYWQIENEPFLNFGVCPLSDANLLDREIAVARATDPTRKVIVTDSGELSLWVNAAKRADIFGTTMYRNIYSERFGYYTYPIGPRFFIAKYWLSRILTGQKNAIVAELQAEPWIKGYTTNAPLSEQFKSMNPAQLEKNVEYAKEVGFPEIYLWGVEWWYWLKDKQGDPEMWNVAKRLFAENQ